MRQTVHMVSRTLQCVVPAPCEVHSVFQVIRASRRVRALDRGFPTLTSSRHDALAAGQPRQMEVRNHECQLGKAWRL